MSEKEFECCLSVMNIDNFSFVVCLYRLPQQCFIETFLDKFDNLYKIVNSIFKIYSYYRRLHYKCIEQNQQFHRFVNILDAYNLKYKVQFPTRITAESQTDIDNFISNKPEKNIIPNWSNHSYIRPRP